MVAVAKASHSLARHRIGHSIRRLLVLEQSLSQVSDFPGVEQLLLTQGSLLGMDHPHSDPLASCPRLARVSQHLDENPDRPVSLEDAARVAGLERKYFSEYVIAKTGWRFRELREHRRISRAVNLLSETTLSITEIANRVGYDDLGTFERAFKRQHGLTPREFRSEVHVRPHQDDRTPS